jgi:hypothetical protein
MDEGSRSFEARALGNVRALLDKLERLDAAQRRRDLIALAILVTPLLLLALRMLFSESPDAGRDRAREACELDAFNKRAMEIQLRLQSGSGMTGRDIQEEIRRQRPILVAQARVDCAPVPK